MSSTSQVSLRLTAWPWKIRTMNKPRLSQRPPASRSREARAGAPVGSPDSDSVRIPAELTRWIVTGKDNKSGIIGNKREVIEVTKRRVKPNETRRPREPSTSEAEADVSVNTRIEAEQEGMADTSVKRTTREG
ncbi:hypothetical protein R1flu_022025 [Riccia fluitans]|uniref:Uncharacterized protein n=1 Tax=Riccia fluitans TaxID=41844 RepID=A0ABD1ZR20_9MARC